LNQLTDFKENNMNVASMDHPTLAFLYSGIPFLGLKGPGHEADHTPPSSAEVKNAWSYTSTTTIPLHGVVLS
jgi:hypothetical protein